jgi:hypothetical protein
MAQITLQYPDAQAQRIVEAFSNTYGWQAQITNPDGTTTNNPETKAQFTKRQIGNFIKQTVMAWEATKAASDARDAAMQNPQVDVQ